MSSDWRQTGDAGDSDDDVVFMGPVTQREREISRLLNETIGLSEPDTSDSANNTLAGLESGLRAVTLEGGSESATMNELELPIISAAGCSSRSTRSHLDESAAPLASGETTFDDQPLCSTRLTEEGRRWEELPSEDPLVPPPAEQSTVWEEMPSENPLPAPPAGEESRVWEEMPSENPLPAPPAGEESRVWEEMPSENPGPATGAEESQQWEELPSECPLPAPPAEESQQWEELPSECPLPADAEESRQWEELPSECPLPVPPPAEESRQWEELPSECPLPVPPPAEESRQWEELPSECPLPAPPAEESQHWEELPSENPLPAPPAAEESRVWEELPSENPLPAPPAEESQQWEELPSECPLPAPPPAEESLCDDLSEETDPAGTGSLWLTLNSAGAPSRLRDSLNTHRSTPGTLLGALSSELSPPRDAPRIRVTGATPRVAPPMSPRSPGSGGGLLQAMQRHLSSPGGGSVDSYHTCCGAADDSRRLTAASGLSDISLTPAAPPNSTMGAETGGDSESEDDSRMYESSVEEQPERRLSVVRESQESAPSNARSPSPSGRDRLSSLASETSLAGSYMSGASTGSELNDTLEMMEKLLAMEAEERRLESILQSRTAGGEPAGRDGSEAVEGGEAEERASGVGEESVVTAAPPVVTPSRPAAVAKTTLVPNPTPRGRGRPAVVAPRHQTPSKSPARLATPRGRAAPSPARSAMSSSSAGSRLKTPTAGGRPATVAPSPGTPRTKPNLRDIVSPVARYIHDGPEPFLVQNLRPRNRLLNTAVPQPRPAPSTLAPLAEEAASSQETGGVLKELNLSAASGGSSASGVSAGSGSSAAGGSRIPVKVSRSARGRENQAPQQTSLPKVTYKSSGNLVMDKTAWNKLVRKNTAENRKVGRFVPSPSPVFAVKHTGHRSIPSRRVRWNDEFSMPDSTVRVRPLRRSVSDCDITQGSEGSFMEVSVCEVRSVRPAAPRH